MKQKEKARFVRNLTASVAKAVIEDLEKMPEEWDGHQIRLYLAEAFAFEAAYTRDNLPAYRRYLRDKRSAQASSPTHY